MTKEEFGRLKELNHGLTDAEERIARLKSHAESTTAILTGMPADHNPLKSKVADSIAKLYDAANEMEQMRLEQLMLKNKLALEASRLPSFQAQLLTMRYIDETSMHEIARVLKCPVGKLFYLHRKAVKLLLELKN